MRVGTKMHWNRRKSRMTVYKIYLVLIVKNRNGKQRRMVILEIGAEIVPQKQKIIFYVRRKEKNINAAMLSRMIGNSTVKWLCSLFFVF